MKRSLTLAPMTRSVNAMKKGQMKRSLAFALLTLAAASVSLAQQQFVYPAKGQSAEQQKKDEYECHTWAVQQTGFDPTKPAQASAPAPTATAPTTPTGATPGAGVRGAARGAVVGEIVADDARAGAAVGAVAARGASRQANRQQQAAQQQQQQQSTQQQQSQKQAAYGKARAACLEGRGYTVK
jgi:hypothetical protein